MWIFQMTEELVRGTSNLLVTLINWMLAFKIHVFDASLFEETPNKSNFEIWESFLLWMLWRFWKDLVSIC